MRLTGDPLHKPPQEKIYFLKQKKQIRIVTGQTQEETQTIRLEQITFLQHIKLPYLAQRP